MHPGRGNRSRHRLHCRARQGVRGGAARPHACPVAARASTKGHPCARASPDCQPEPAIARGSPLQGCAMGCTNAGQAEPRTQAHPPGWAANRRGESQMPEKKRTRASRARRVRRGVPRAWSGSWPCLDPGASGASVPSGKDLLCRPGRGFVCCPGMGFVCCPGIAPGQGRHIRYTNGAVGEQTHVLRCQRLRSCAGACTTHSHRRMRHGGIARWRCQRICSRCRRRGTKR